MKRRARPDLVGLLDVAIVREALARVVVADPDGPHGRSWKRNVGTPTDALIKLAAKTEGAHARGEIAAALSDRADLLSVATSLASSSVAKERAVAVGLLGQTGALVATVNPVILRAIDDPDEEVVAEALLALARTEALIDIAHTERDATLATILSRQEDGRPLVRFAVAASLAWIAFAAPEKVVPALLGLSADPDVWTRGWASFGLGCVQSDVEAVRVRLLALAEYDPDEEIRGDALFALAERRDPRVTRLIEAALDREMCGIWVPKAAEEFPQRSLLPALERAKARMIDDDLVFRAIQEAIDACAASEPGVEG